MNQGDKDKSEIKMKKNAIVMITLQIFIGESFKAHHDEINRTAMKEENHYETEYAIERISKQWQKWDASEI